MDLRASRLGVGEWLLGVGSMLLLVDLFGASWFAYRPQFHVLATMLGQPPSANGWQSFDAVGPLALIVALAGLAIMWSTAARRSPALPAVLATLLVPVAFAATVLMAVRVLIDPPAVDLIQAGGRNVIEARPGAYVGLVLSIASFVGCWLTVRRDAVIADDAPRTIETLRVGGPGSTSPAQDPLAAPDPHPVQSPPGAQNPRPA